MSAREGAEPWQRRVGSTARPTERIKRGAKVDTRDGHRWITYRDDIDGTQVIVEMPSNAPTRSCEHGRHDDCLHRLGGPAEGGVTIKLSLPGFTWRCGCPCHSDPFRAGRLFFDTRAPLDGQGVGGQGGSTGGGGGAVDTVSLNSTKTPTKGMVSLSRDTSTTPAQPSAGDDWWTHITTSAIHVPISELIAGLDEIATHSIPYARLPRRAHIYAPEFACWSDIATQTVHSLLSRPKAGEATVRALLTAAKTAVTDHRTAASSTRLGPAAAVRRLLDKLDTRDRLILSARLWAVRPESQPALAERLSVNRVTIQRNQPRAVARFAELVADPAHHEVTEYVDTLRRQLGPYAPLDVAAKELRRLHVDPSSQTAQVLLHLAGPYLQRDGWFENATTGGHQQVTAAVDAIFDRSPAPTNTSLTAALTNLGMAPHIATTYLDSQDTLRRFGAIWVRWGDSTADEAEAVLHVRHTPATSDEITAAIGTGTTSERTLRKILYTDPRFVRASRHTWGLRSWAINEYTSVIDAITARIDAAGGQTTTDELIHDLLARLPDVAESSVRSYISTRAFINEAGTIRRRTDTDIWPPVPPLNTTRGAFRNGANEIWLALPVTTEMLRGSGQHIRPAVATALGVNPGQRRAFASPHGQVTVTWRLTATNGPSIGSLRAPAIATSATLADTLVLVFRLIDTSLDFTRIGAGTTGIHRLRQLLGRTVRTPAAALAASLNCPRADVAAVLRNRGDTDLAELID
ncbi:MAG: hypothetical protein JWR32_2642 [Mycobacterium sp.]|nr:hypothetical protein [Mycobacterium sp.]